MKTIHKTSFTNGEMCKYKSMTFKKFKAMFEHVYFKISIGDVYIELGGDKADTIEPVPEVKPKKGDKSE